MQTVADRWDPTASPLEIYQREFDRGHWFNRRASLLWNSSTLINRTPSPSRTVPTFESSSVYFAGYAGTRCTYKSTANDGKGVSFGSYAPCQTGTGTWVFRFSVPSLAVAANLYLTAGLLEAIGLQIRISTAGKVELVRINTVVFHTGTTVLLVNKPYTVAITYNESSGAGAVFIDGRLDSEIATVRAFAHGTIRLMSNAYTVEDGAMRMFLAAVSPYTSSYEQLASLSRDPLQLLEPYPWWMFAMDAVSGGSLQTISPSGIASAETFGTTTITPGAVTVSPSGIASLEAFGTAVVTPGTVTLSPSGIASDEAFGTTVLTPGAVTVLPSGIASAEMFGDPVVSAGTLTITGAGAITSEEAFGTAVLTPGAVTVLPSGIASLEGFGTYTVTSASLQAITGAGGIVSAEMFGSFEVILFVAGELLTVSASDESVTAIAFDDGLVTIATVREGLTQ